MFSARAESIQLLKFFQEYYPGFLFEALEFIFAVSYYSQSPWRKSDFELLNLSHIFARFDRFRMYVR